MNVRLLPGEGRQAVPLAEQLGALDDLLSEGKLELIGLSNVSRAQAAQALELVAVAAIQNAYSLLNRSSDDLLELCRLRDLAFVPFFPLGSALTGGPAKLAADPIVSRVAVKHGATPSQIALAWLLHRDERILLIPGTSSVAHLQENLAAGDVALDPEHGTALEAVAQQGDPETVSR